MKNKSYWKNRFEQMEKAVNQKANVSFNQIERQFTQAEREIERQISNWYQRFATNNEISMQEARKWLTSKQLKEFKWDVNQYIKYGEQNELNHMWMKQLENASAKVHISRLESLKLQMQQQVEVLYGNQLDNIDSLVKRVYTDDYYRSIFEVQKGFNIGWDIAAIDSDRLERIISKPWTVDGRNFSNRIWDNKSKLINELHNELSQTIITGRSPDVAIKNIARKMNTSKVNAGRLVMTESAYFASESQKDAFDELDVERYEIVATLDSSTSEICRGLDGEVFDMKDYEPGVTAPPFHVWCRTTTVPFFDDNFTERAAKNADGKTYYVPGNMKFDDWYEKHVA